MEHEYVVSVTTVTSYKTTVRAASHDDALSEVCKRIRSGMLDGMEVDGPGIAETHTHGVAAPLDLNVPP